MNPLLASEPAAGRPSLDATSLAERVDGLRLQLVGESMLRVPAVLLLSNAFASWLLWRTGWLVMAVVWFVLMSGVHFGRWILVTRWQRQPPPSVARGNRWLAAAVMAVAAMQSLLVVLVFLGDYTVEHYLVTMHCAGVAAYAVVATGWRPKLLAAWIGLLGSVLVVGWVGQGDAAGVGMAVMSASYLATLLAQASTGQQALVRMVSLAWDNEQLATSLRFERDKAQAANESKTRFFAAASHDLRQPLQALSISAYALAMLARREGQPKMVQMVDTIERALRQSTGLLDGLLDVSRLDAGAVQVDWREIDLASMLDGLASEFRPLAGQRGLTLTVQHPDGLQAVRSDGDLLRRVLTNLLGNSLKFTRSGGVRLEAGPAADGRVRLSVIDTGIGITPADQARVFEEFYQAANPARDRSQGLGLGLSIVRRIAVLLDIGLQLHSAPGEGTRIDLLLPSAPASTALPQDAAAAPVPAAALPLPANLPVLVIDDEADIREAMQSLLEQLGCVAETAEDQASALSRVRAGFRPAVILSDHRLREGDGLGALTALRAELGEVATLVVTGDTAPDTLAHLLASGHRVLHKPVDGATLARALGEAMAPGR